MDRLATIRKKEKEYHDDCYANTDLFEPGSWLHKPVKTIMDLLDLFNNRTEINVLDLGCGVGRNCIPIAQKFLHKDITITCVDLLESAISNLEEYSRRFQVWDKINPILSDISDYPIPDCYFDLIFSVSSLEHLESERTFDDVLQKIVRGTKPQGINCFIISTSIKESIIETGERIDPMFELIFDSIYLKNKFETLYEDWKLIKHTVKPYSIEIMRDDQNVLLESEVVTWVVQKTL